MQIYDVAKDILVPLLSPLVAAVAIIFAIRQERQKLVAQQEHSLQTQLRAVEREALNLRELYQLLGLTLNQGEAIADEQHDVLNESAERLFNALHDSPAVYEAYFDSGSTRIQRVRLPLLLTELEIRMRQLKSRKSADPVVLFGLYLLIYARADTDQTAESEDVLDEIFKTQPDLFGAWWAPKT